MHPTRPGTNPSPAEPDFRPGQGRADKAGAEGPGVRRPATGTRAYPATLAIWTRRVRLSSTRKCGHRRAISSRATWLSIRARAAPRQVWIPNPKPKAGPGFRVMSNRSGSANSRSSRVAAPVSSNTGNPAGMVVPCHSESCIEKRPWYWDGGQNRRISSTAPGRRPGSASSWAHWSGWRAKRTKALLTNLVTVSAPAPPRSAANPAISASVRAVVVPSSRSMVAWVSWLSMSSPGSRRFWRARSWK